MSEAGPSPAAPPTEVAAPDSGEPAAPTRRGRARAGRVSGWWLLWLLTVAALGAASWRFVYQPLDARATAIQQQLVRTRAEVDALAEAHGALTGQLEAERAATRSLREALAHLEARASGQETAWRLAEAEYLLRQAAHAARLGRDPRLVETALGGADHALAATGAAQWLPVREDIARARAALAGVEVVDTVSLLLDLRAHAQALEKAPLRGEPLATGPRNLPQAQSWRERLERLVRDVFVLRRVDSPGLPDRALVRIQLRLRFLQAELALERRDSEALAVHVEDLRQLVQAHYDPDAPAVAAVQRELNELGGLNLSPALPDLSDLPERLRTLRDARDLPEDIP